MEALIGGLVAIPGLKLYGITDPKQFDRRCPTIAVRIKGHTPLQLATKLGDRGFFTWDGNYYALNLTERLDVEKDGGIFAHRAGALQHSGRSGAVVGGVAGNCRVTSRFFFVDYFRNSSI